eukprot:1003385-Rhodomonas_salina.4
MPRLKGYPCYRSWTTLTRNMYASSSSLLRWGVKVRESGVAGQVQGGRPCAARAALLRRP